MSSASWAEIVWTVGALAGLMCNLALLMVAQGDMSRLRRHGRNGARLLVAKGNRRTEVHRVLVQAVFLAFGVWAALTPPARPGPVSLLGIVLTVALVSVQVLLVAGSVLDLRDRHELIRYIDMVEAEGRKDNSR